MSRHLYLGFLAVVTIMGALLFAHEMKAPLAGPAAPTAEFGGVSLTLDYATSTEARERGLSGRANVPDGYGMLFIFLKEDRYGFWMKDMIVPIDIFWLDDKGQVASMRQDVATSTYPNVFYPPTPVRYVLETSAGFAEAHQIATGTPLLLKNLPSVSE